MNEDKIISKLLEHDDKFVELDEKISDVKRTVLTSHEEIMTVLKRLDQERVFTIEWVRRLEGEIQEQRKKTDEHESWLKRIREHLHLA